MPADLLTLLFAALAFAIVYMSVVWTVSERIRNAGIVDIAWSFGFAPIAIFYAAFGPGNPLRCEG